MKKWICAVVFALGSLQAIQVPMQFQMQFKPLLRTGFDIVDQSEHWASVMLHWECNSFPEYVFMDGNDELQATMSMTTLASGVQFQLRDAEGALLGTMQQNGNKFTIFSAYNTPIANISLNFWGTKYSIRDAASNQVFATASRKTCCAEKWSVDWQGDGRIDPCFVLGVLAFAMNSAYR